MRAYELAPEAEREAAEQDFWILASEQPPLLSLAASQYRELIQTEKLRPAMLTEEQIQRYEKASRETEDAPPYIQGEHNREAWDRWHTLLEDREKLQKELYAEALQNWSPEQAQRLLDGLQTLIEHPEMMSVEEAPDLAWLISWTYCSGEQLYRTGFPEQVRWIDEFKAGLYEEDGIGDKVAIIQEPSSYDLDEQGHYKRENPLEQMERYLSVTHLEEQLQKEGSSLTKHLQELTTGARLKIKGFLASQAVTEAVSKAVDIPFDEDTERDFAHIQNVVEKFNLLAKEQPLLPHLPEGLKLPQIRVARMRPKQETVQYLRERIAMALGDKWWEEIKRIEIDFEEQFEQEED
jgi:hypothetical protein